MGVVASFISGVSIFKATIWHFYLPPLFGISIIIFAQTIAGQKHLFFRTLGLIWIILFTAQFFIYYPPRIKFFSSAREIESATTMLAQRIKDVQGQKRYSKPDFFLIKVYTQDVETPTIESLAFWLPLEQKLNNKFIQVDDETSSFKRLNSHEYIYVICQSYAAIISISKDCIEPFSKEFPKHKINRIVYEKGPFTIFEAVLYPSIGASVRQPGTE